MAEKVTKWLPLAKEILVVGLALAALYSSLRADTDRNSAGLDKQIALQALTDSIQTTRIDKLERIAERQDELIRSLDRLVAKLERSSDVRQ